jgi:MrcB-like, N-terminal domain
MGLSDLTDRNAVLSAIAEYDRMGQTAFLEKYGYAPARRYRLAYNGNTYDSKAIAGAAYAYQFPHQGPLKHEQFSGGEQTVVPVLERLGFEVQNLEARDTSGVSITAADIALLRESRSKARYTDLSEEEHAAYRRIHAGLEALGREAQQMLGGDKLYSLKLTSGFHPRSGVRGNLPKDLWFGVSRVDDLVGMPQLFMIVSGRGIEYGFAACIPPEQFSNRDIQERVRAAAPTIFASLPSPGSNETIRLQLKLEQTGSWFFRKRTRSDPDTEDFTTLDSWLSFLKSPEGAAEAGGSISRYLSPEELGAGVRDLSHLVSEMAEIFSTLIAIAKPSAVEPTTPSVQKSLESFLSKYGPIRSTTPFGQHGPLKVLLNEVRTGLQEMSSLRAYPHVSVSWSLGAVNWADIPWVALMDDRETTSTQRGKYVVFLFPQDTSGVFLTLNQGVTDIIEKKGRAEGRQVLREEASIIRNLVGEQLSGRFQLDDGIDLHTDGALGQDYEAGTIAYRFYRRGEVPLDSEINDDLGVLLKAYSDVLEKRIETCPASAPMRQILRIEEGRISGSS